MKGVHFLVLQSYDSIYFTRRKQLNEIICFSSTIHYNPEPSTVETYHERGGSNRKLKSLPSLYAIHDTQWPMLPFFKYRAWRGIYYPIRRNTSKSLPILTRLAFYSDCRSLMVTSSFDRAWQVDQKTI